MNLEEYCLISGDMPLSCEHPKKIITKDNGILTVPCRKCRQCRKNISYMWSNRLSNQLTSSEKAVFVTLTYNDLFVDDISKREMQLFFKKFRKFFPDISLKYFCCGEYGEKSGRPHYHMIIFGIDQKMLTSARISGISYSKQIESCWKKGFYKIGNVNGKVINYVTGYLLKSQKGFRIMSKGLGKENTLSNQASLREMFIRNRCNLDRYQQKLLDISFEQTFNRSLKNRKEFMEKHGCTILGELSNLNKKRSEYNAILNQTKDELFHKEGIL